MSAHTFPGLGLTGGRSSGESGWAVEMNTNLLTASVVAQLSVKSIVTALPGSPTNGDIYLVAHSGTSGTAVGHEDAVAARDNGAWVFFTPKKGWRAYIEDQDATLIWKGSAWTAATAPIDVGTSIAGTPGVSEKVLMYVFARAVSFPDDFGGSKAVAGTAATGSTVFSIKKNGSSIGTITFSASGTTGAFATTGSSAETFAVGDVLSIVAPGSADATLADISITLTGTR